MKQQEQPAFKIGDWVKVTHIAVKAVGEMEKRRFSTGSPVSFIPAELEEPMVGQVVGYAYRHAGFYIRGSGWGEDYEQGYIQDREVVRIVQVRFSLSNTPIDVLPDGLHRVRVPHSRNLPMRLGSTWCFSKAAYAALEEHRKSRQPAPTSK